MWLRNVREAFLALFVWRGILPLLVQLDRLGNALCGGSANTTISGRTGFYSIARKNPYWQYLEAVIDFAFYPVDGNGHCYQAWFLEQGLDHRRGNDIGLFFLSITVVIACIFISIFTYGRLAWDGLVTYLKQHRKQ